MSTRLHIFLVVSIVLVSVATLNNVD